MVCHQSRDASRITRNVFGLGSCHAVHLRGELRHAHAVGESGQGTGLPT